jgi:hypothetical protein
MSDRETEQERFVRLRIEARKLNEELGLPSRITIMGGGRRGPFTVTIERLGKRQARQVVLAVKAILEGGKA